jgi:hypothetical protein
VVEPLRGASLKKGYICEPCALGIREKVCRRAESLDPRTALASAGKSKSGRTAVPTYLHIRRLPRWSCLDIR